MRFTSVATAFSVVLGVQARNLFSLSDVTITASKDDLKVPGNSPLQYCNVPHEENVLTINKIDLNPNPPLAGKDLVIFAEGELSEDVLEGAYAEVTVRLGMIKLLHKTFDICDEITGIDMECPLKKGPISLSTTVKLPAEIPPGTYTATADVFTVDDKQITCLTTTLSLNKPFSLEL